MTAQEFVLLRAGGVALVLDATGPQPPRVLHWGADLGDLDEEALASLRDVAVPAVPLSAVDEPWWLTVLPGETDGWQGRPGLSAHRDGAACVPRWETTALQVVRDPDGTDRVQVAARDAAEGLEWQAELQLAPSGVVRVRHLVRNVAQHLPPLTVVDLPVLMPLPPDAAELLDLTGRYARERVPQRQPWHHGTRLRESRRGRTGHDAPLVLAAGSDGFGYRHGEVWAVHVAWSGDHVHLAERLPERAGQASGVLGGGEMLRPGEIRLGPGGGYRTPWVWFVWSGEGLDGVASRLHRSVRARPRHPRTPRPVVLNTWEAVYFDQDLSTLSRLARTAADVGVERFVLDDGWFLGRRDDTSALGDWEVDPQVWPDGLHPIVATVRSLGMEFGLWLEPEMVSRDSHLARAHPDWLLAPTGRVPREWRHQQVLDLSRPEVRAHLLDRLDALIGEYRLDAVKWDHNRDLLEAVTHDGRAGVHRQTEALYSLLDEVRRRHPGVEIESCAAGGGRVDLAILEHTDRVWASDTNDALERQRVQRWTLQLLPPELVGAHVGPPVAHTTGRTGDLAFRCLTALFGHAGLEWDLTTASERELEVLRRWTALYRELRGLLHSGEVVRADHPDPAVWVHGVVAADRREAVFCFARLDTSLEAHPGRVRLPGLDPRRRYRVRVRDDLDVEASAMVLPPWVVAPPPVLPGSVLDRVGVAMPLTSPGSAVLLHLTDAGSGSSSTNRP